MKSLDEIGMIYNTDKASSRSGPGGTIPGHDLLRHYQRVVEPLRARDRLFVLDLGMGLVPHEFASAQMWRDYLPQASVVSVDLRAPKVNVPDGVEFRQGNLGDLRFLVSLVQDVAPDLVVDDASHLWNHQIMSLTYLLPRVASGGVFIWEDIHTSHAKLSAQYGGGMQYSAASYFADIAVRFLTGRLFSQPTAGPFTGDPPGITEAVIAALVPLIDYIEVMPEAVAFHRR